MAMCGLGALRWMTPPSSAPTIELADALLTSPVPLVDPHGTKSELISSASGTATSRGTTDVGPTAADTAFEQQVLNPFAVRIVIPAEPDLPLVVSAPEPAPMPPPLEVTENLPVEAPLPFMVIGTWDDAAVPGVFITGPSGTLLAQRGTVLWSEYRVNELTANEVSITQLDSGREYRIGIPRGGR